MKFCTNCGQLIVKEELLEDIQAAEQAAGQAAEQVAQAAEHTRPPKPADGTFPPRPADGSAPPQGAPVRPENTSPAAQRPEYQANPYGPKLTGQSAQYAGDNTAAAATAVAAPVGTAAWQAQNNAAVQPVNGEPAPAATKKKTDVFGIISLIAGIASLTGSCCCVRGLSVMTVLLGIAAIVMAILSKSKSDNKKMSGMAVGGMIMGIAGIVLGIIMLAISAVVKAAVRSGSFDVSDLPEELEELLEKLGIDLEDLLGNLN
jgi:hypothetical protein